MTTIDDKAAERRLIKLAAWFLARGEPATREEVYDAFPDDYTGKPSAKEKKWSRDKRDLQHLGVPLRFVEELDEKGAYTIDPGSFYLPKLEFTASEAAVLQTAARAALGDPDHPLHEDVEGALRKLLLGAAGLPPRAATLESARDPAAPPQLRRWLSIVADAVEDRRTLHLEYWVPARDEVTSRDVSPFGYGWRRGDWILVGYCHLRKAVRVFYLRRARALAPAKLKKGPPHYDIPADFDVRGWSRQEPWDYLAHAPTEAAVRFRGSLAKIAPKLLPRAKFALAADNSRTARVVVRNLDGLVRQCLAWGPEAELVEPEAGRARAREILEALDASGAAE
jgi:proteasome accessory factor B